MARLAKALLFSLCFLLMPGEQPQAASAGKGLSVPTGDITTIPSDVSGTTVWLRRDTTQPLIALTAELPAGSAYDPIAKSGLAALAARLLSSGALLPARQGRKLTDTPDVRVSATATRDRLKISLLVSPENAAGICRLMGQALAHPRLSVRALNLGRLDQMQDLEERAQDPVRHARDLLYSFYYGAHGYGHPVMGSKPALAAIRRQDVLHFIHSHWVRGRIVLAIAGNADADTAKKLTRLMFAPLAAANVPAIPRPQFTGAPGLHHIAMPIAQPVAMIALPGLSAHDQNLLTARITTFILGGYANARLDKSLRDHHQLTDQVRTRLLSQQASGMAVTTLQSAPQDMRMALSFLRQDLRRYAMEGPTNPEFSVAKRFFRNSRPLDFASEASSAHTMARAMSRGWSIARLQGKDPKIEQLSFHAVRQMAKWLYHSEDLTIVVLGPLPRAERSSNPYRP